MNDDTNQMKKWSSFWNGGQKEDMKVKMKTWMNEEISSVAARSSYALSVSFL